MHTEFAPGGMVVLLSLIPLIIYLGLLIFVIYFVVKLISFMKEKIKLDRMRNEKLNELIQMMHQERKERE